MNDEKDGKTDMTSVLILKDLEVKKISPILTVVQQDFVLRCITVTRSARIF